MCKSPIQLKNHKIITTETAFVNRRLYQIYNSFLLRNMHYFFEKHSTLVKQCKHKPLVGFVKE